MKAELEKQDQILSTIGLKRLMVWQSSVPSIYDETKFKNYISSEYKESQRSITDEFYRMFEFNLLHIETGLRVTLTTSESYDGETVEYKVIGMFILSSSNSKLEVIDADFERRIFFTSDLEIPFVETGKV